MYCESDTFEQVYGKDAHKFLPERWLESSPEQLKIMERCGIWFGIGKHVCIGQFFMRISVYFYFYFLFLFQSPMFTAANS